MRNHEAPTCDVAQATGLRPGAHLCGHEDYGQRRLPRRSVRGRRAEPRRCSRSDDVSVKAPASEIEAVTTVLTGCCLTCSEGTAVTG